MKITNTSRAPQGVHTTQGLRFIAPGETRELDVLEGYRARVDALPHLSAETPLNEPIKTKEELGTAQGNPGKLPENMPHGNPGDPPAPIVRAEARHLGKGRWGIFLGEERFGDETYSKDEAAAEVDKLNAPLNEPIKKA
jgi:hypothetical protein